MKIWANLTIIFTIITVILIPIIGYYSDTANAESEQELQIQVLEELQDFITLAVVESYRLGYSDGKNEIDPTEREKILREVWDNIFEEQIEELEKMDEHKLQRKDR